VERAHPTSLDANDKLIQTRSHVRDTTVSRKRQVIMRKVKSTIAARRGSNWYDRRGRPTEWRYLNTVRADNPEKQSLLCFRLTENRT